jgi:hypothetical protein
VDNRGPKNPAQLKSLASFTKLVEVFGEVRKTRFLGITNIGHIDKVYAPVT